MNLDILKSHPYISPDIKIEKFTDPYPHIVIDNLFKPEIYQKMCDKFQTYISRVEKPYGQVGDSGNTYDALICGMGEEDCIEGYDFFKLKLWQNFISNIFDLEFNQHMAYSLHFHKGSPEKPSRDGWPHLDLNVCSVIDDLEKPIKLTGECNYADDTFNLQPNVSKTLRSVAMLYYFNNKNDQQEGDGGGTAIFKNYDKDSLVKEVKPNNNRLFAFEVSPKSYHGFVGAKFDRAAIVSWFHSSPSYIVKKNLDAYKEKFLQKGEIFEYWTKDNKWTLDKDPDYDKFFDKPLNEIFKK
jgi:hypothetical protein